MKAEILEKIVYPTGGYTIFEFEPNDYVRQGASFTEAPMVEYVWESSQFSFEDGYFDVDPATINFTLTQPTLVTVSKSIKRSGPNTAWFPGTETYETKSYTYGAGTYNLRTIFNTDQLTTDANSDVHYALGSVSWRKEIPISPNRPKLAGGLRIKSIRSFDGIKESMKTFEYKEEDSYSSGFLSMYPTFFVPMSELWPNMNGIYLSSEPINDTPEGPSVGYSRVVERFPDNSYTVHKFTTYGDYPDQENSFNEGTSNGLLAHLTSMNFMRGLENEVITYDINNRPLKRVINEYEVLSGASLNIVGVDIKPTFNFPSELSNWNGLYYGILTSRYAIPRRFTYKKKSYQISFDSGESNPLTTSTEYFYGNPKHVQPNRVIITKSDGGQEVIESLYSLDYATGTAFIDNMKNNNLLAHPIEQVRYKEVGTTRTILSGTITKYLAGGKGLVDQVLELETSQPIALSSFKFSNRAAGQLPSGSTGATTFSPHSGYKSRLIYSNYDAYGNARQVQPASGPPVTYIWSYKGQYPVAEIKNALFTDIQTKLGGDQTVNTFTDSYPSDTDLRTKFNGIRSLLPNSALSYYTYDPLNGMTSATDPSGRTTYYNYDGFGRLKEIKDTQSKTTDTYEYHYRQ
ncbi:YD repeat-containing protein [Olivibacter sp. 47]|uniref:RHS repeat domain-containing protein n=1 Tax=Olivibacter sp. 47 TaxID=3056486 RepID=UPI0025A43F32|nr:RHS repeat domain-containing protein [Olivibacter sp. 47]MDM8176924.1 YD repeat-containing protein [Olivibacter sp. 47]